MADKTLTSLVGDGNWVVKSFHTDPLQETGSADAGEVLRITPPSGCKVRVTHLAANVASNSMSVLFGAREVFNGPINDDGFAGALTITTTLGMTSNNYVRQGVLSSIEGKVDEAFVLYAATTTGQVIYYAYEIMEQS